MSETKKSTVGIVLAALTVIAAAAALIAYYVNSQTSYFSNLGLSTTVVACLAVAIVAEVVFIVAGLKGNAIWQDLLPVAVSVLLVVATITLVSVRVNGFAAIISYENNSSNMADMMSAIVAIACGLVATIVSVISAHFDISK